MKIIKNFLIGLGCLFALIVIFAVFIGVKSSGFKDEQSDFIRRFVSDFSQRWEISDVKHMVTNDFLEQVSSQQAVNALSLFRRLGKLETIDDIELNNFKTHFGFNSYKRSGEHGAGM